VDRAFLIRAAASLAVLLSADVASAQWTLPQGDIVLDSGFDFQFADQEYFGLDGEPKSLRNFPLNGQYFGASFNLGVRAGFTDRLEMELLIPFRIVSYTSDPVVLVAQPADSMQSSLDYYQQNVIDLSEADAGLADVQIAARYRWTGHPFVTTTELRLKVPGGYDGPAGTFGERPESTEVFLANVGEFVRPGNVQDDVTLGDGQIDISVSQLFGVGFRSGTFIAGDVGYRLRLDGAADQVTSSLRIGQRLGRRLLAFVGGSSAISVEDGRVIGVSVAATDPNVPAEEYGGLDNLLLREVELRRDYVNVFGGLILRLTDEAEMKLAYGRTAWGRNVAAVNTFTLAFAGRMHLFEAAAPPEPEPEPEPVEEEPYEDEAPYEEEQSETESPSPIDEDSEVLPEDPVERPPAEPAP